MSDLITPTIKPTPKQDKAWQKLEDKETKYVTFGGGAGGGKAQTLNSKVLTPSGFVRMGDIKLGDNVITPNNFTAEVIAIHPQGITDVYEIEFVDGAKTKVTKEHLFDCWIAKKPNSRAVRTVEEILKIENNVLIPLSDKLEFGEYYNKIDSYLVGVLLGDGGLTKNNITFTTADVEILEYLNVEDNIIIHKKGYQYSIVSNKRNEKGFPVNQLLDKLRNLGIIPIKCEDRFIPDVIKYGSLSNRLEVLKGLMDTDGYIDKRGHCSFASKSKQLAEDVQYIVRSIGGKATLQKKNKFCYYKGERKECVCYEVYIQTKDNRDLFKLKRKLERVSTFNGSYSELGRRIKSIKKVKSENTQCITLNTEDGLYITDDFIVTHNSWLGCEWLLVNCYRYPGTKWFIGRNELKRLMQSSFITWKKVCKYHNIPTSDWKLNGQYNYIQFNNGSQIDLLDVKYLPTDPLYERFGSTEYTGGWLEEAGEIDFGAFDVLKSRIGRHMNKDYNVASKLFITCNPKKNWLYREVYKPYKEKTLPTEYAFIQSLYGDNPHTADEYEDNLKQIKDKAMRERLMHGNWEYDDDPNTLIDYDAIVDMFTNAVDSGEKYLVADVARFGKDKTVVYLFEGLMLYKVYVWLKQSTNITADRIDKILQDEQIPRSHALIDEDGIGGGVVDNLPGVKGFIANSRPMESREYKPIDSLRNGKIIFRVPKQNFKNLKAQCSYLLADEINNHRVAVDRNIKFEADGNITYETFKANLIEELEQIKAKDIDDDEKPLNIISKEEVKEAIGRSPDYSDTLMMRIYFFLNKTVATNEVGLEPSFDFYI